MSKVGLILLWLNLLGPVSLAMAQAPVAFRFEADTETWRARARSIAVTHQAGAGATQTSRGHLHICGRIADGWNYAGSERRPLEPGRLYRLTAWVRVDRLGPTTPPPYLKCEFIGRSPHSTLGQVHTERCDTSRLGRWQEVAAEFKSPADAAACWLALEKGTSEAAEIDARLDEIRLEPIARLSALEQCRVKPYPPSLEKVRGVHPRLFVDASRVAELRRAIETTHAPLWREVRKLADAAAKRGPPAYREQDGHSGEEQLWQREVGNAMPLLAMAYVLSGQQTYLHAARDWAVASCGYKTWGLGRIDGMDLATGHQLFGLGIVYDWCYADLDQTSRRTIRDTLVRRGTAMFEAAATGKAWWGRSYLQNHLWVDACGLSVAGLAVLDEQPDAELWVGLALQKFRRTADALGSDGASHEGVGYWEYGVEYLLKFMELARQRLDVDLYGGDWWRNTASYGMYLSLPRAAWTRGNCIVDLADCPRGHWYGPDHLLRRLASEYRDPHAQWLAGQIGEAGVAAPSAPWLNLVWYDPRVPAQPPAALPTLRHFRDMDIVSARSDWSGSESLVVFKCGPFLGHHAVHAFKYDPGGGHVHPDTGHFVLFGGGQWLIRDDGYRAKWTGQHNTLLIDGRGQLGEGAQWFQGTQPLAVKACPRIVQAQSTPTVDHIVGDATAAYPAELGLQHFHRHLVYLKPDVLVIADDIRVDRARKLELRFHPEQPPRPGSPGDGRELVFAGRSATLRLEPLTPHDVQIAAEPLAAQGRHGEKEQKMHTVRLARTAAQWRNIVALSWAATGQPIRRVELETRGEQVIFRCGKQAASLHWDAGR